MARIDALPSLEIIRGLKGILDFYVWRGLPCVRAWPKYRPAKQTAASLAAALVFGAIVKSYSLLAPEALDAYKAMLSPVPRTARDLMVSGVYGNLHEASMSDFLDLLTECRDFLSDLTALLNALDSISVDEIDVNVERSILPTGAATSAAQATQLTALQKIDDLQDALQSKALDRLLVRGTDQLFSFMEPLSHRDTGLISGANGFYNTTSPPAGTLWVLTRGAARDQTSPTTEHVHYYSRAGVTTLAHLETRAFPQWSWSLWQGLVILTNPDFLRIEVSGSQAGDTISVSMLGYKMTLET